MTFGEANEMSTLCPLPFPEERWWPTGVGSEGPKVLQLLPPGSRHVGFLDRTFFRDSLQILHVPHPMSHGDKKLNKFTLGLFLMICPM